MPPHCEAAAGAAPLPGVYFPGSSSTDADIVIFCLHVAEFFYTRIPAIVKFLYIRVWTQICKREKKGDNEEYTHSKIESCGTEHFEQLSE